MKFVKTITFEANNQEEADQVQNAISTITNSIEEKKHLIQLGSIIGSKPGLIKKAIPYLDKLKYL